METKKEEPFDPAELTWNELCSGVPKATPEEKARLLSILAGTYEDCE